MNPASPGRWPDDEDGEELGADFGDDFTADDFFEPTGSAGGSREWARTWPADERLADRAAAALRCEPLLSGRRLEIIVQNGVVILIGELGSAEARAAAGSRVWRISGVADVCNRLTVAETDPGSDRASRRPQCCL